MGAVRHGYAVAHPTDAPIDFAALREATKDMTDDDLEGCEYWDGKGSFDYELAEAETYITKGYISSYSEDGWTIWYHAADDWGDGGDDYNRALRALCSALWAEGAPKPGAGGAMHTTTSDTSGVPKIKNKDDWYGAA